MRDKHRGKDRQQTKTEREGRDRDTNRLALSHSLCQVRREYKNFRLEVPYTHSIYNATTALQSVRWLNDEYIQVEEEEEERDLRLIASYIVILTYRRLVFV